MSTNSEDFRERMMTCKVKLLEHNYFLFINLSFPAHLIGYIY